MSIKIGSTTSTSRVQPSVSGQKSVDPSYRFEDRLKFSEKEMERQVSESDIETLEIEKILLNVIKDVLSNGCSIQSRNVLSNEKYNIEASFQPPMRAGMLPKIFVPIAGSSFCLEGQNSIFSGRSEAALLKISNTITNLISYTSNKSLVKLTILLSHEYGHFLSYQRGYHNRELKAGLALMSRYIPSGADKYVYEVFSEEVTAWRFARQILERYQFKYWDIFESSKYSSLNAYYKVLKLESLNVSTYCKLSMLDIELSRVAK